MSSAQPILRRLAEVDWGSAEDLRRLLETVTVGDRDSREAAWRGVWDQIEHDGTIHEDLLPAVPVLIALGDWREYPDRTHAIVLLREVATADGVEPAHDHEQFALLREALAGGTRHLARRWRSEPPQVRRALVWLLSAVPEMVVQYHDLIDATLPDRHRAEWESELLAQHDSDALEAWVYSG